MKRFLLALLLVSAGAFTYAQFESTLAGVFDEGETGAYFQANTTQTGTVDPGHAYEDVDNDGRFTEGEDVPIDDEELADGQYTVDDSAHGLVVPNSVGSIEAPAGPIELEAGANGHLIVDVKLEARSVQLSAGTDLDFTDSTALAQQALALDAGGAIDIESTSLEAGDEINVTAGDRVYARSATIEAAGDIQLQSERGDVLVNAASLEADAWIRIDAGDDARADDALLEAGANVDIAASADVYVKRATLETPQSLQLTAGSSDDAIFVQDARFEDEDDTAQAGPSGVEIVGEPSKGAVET